MSRYAVVLWICLPFMAWGQDDRIFTLTEYLDIVFTHHPITFQASLMGERVDPTQLMARGGFDPKVAAALDRKSYDDKNYYTRIESDIKVPLWFGADVKASYSRNSGQFLNSSESLPDRGIWSLGINVPLGKGLIIDERRAEVGKAEIYANVTEQEQTIMINELILEAILAYQSWQLADSKVQIFQAGVDFATARYENVIGSFINGDKPAIDTLEAKIAIQGRQQALLQAQQAESNSKIALQNFLWQEGYVPLELVPGVRPEANEPSLFQDWVDSLSVFTVEIVETHPELQLYVFKLDQLDIDQRLNKENLKPDVNISFNPLIGSTEDNLFRAYDVNDYKLGASVAYPLFTRKERGKVQITDIKIKETQSQRDLKRQDLITKLNTYLNNSNALREQLLLIEETTDNYASLVNAENQKFQFGESSLFLINSREQKLLESQMKVVESIFKLQKNNLSYLFLTGQLGSLVR